MIQKLLKRILGEEQGQDLIEYSLLMAFVALAVVGIFASSGNYTAAIWGDASTQLTSANSMASGTAGTASGGTPYIPVHHDRH